MFSGALVLYPEVGTGSGGEAEEQTLLRSSCL